jgi:hypothetical protein
LNDSIIETRTTRIWLGTDGILRIVSKPFMMRQSLNDAIENMQALHRARQEEKRPVLVDIRDAIFTDAESRRYYSRAEFSTVIIAAAFIVSSPVSRVIGSLYLGLNKPPYPVRLFDAEEKALEWLSGFLDEANKP